MQAGYSGTPLLKKLGIRETDRIRLLNAPEPYFEWLEKNIQQQICKKNERPDFVHLFATNNNSFEKAMQQILPQIKAETVIWISWYKKSSGKQTDITEDTIRSYALQHNLVDVKVCAVNEEWSGLKLVVPLAKRNLFN